MEAQESQDTFLANWRTRSSVCDSMWEPGELMVEDLVWVRRLENQECTRPRTREDGCLSFSRESKFTIFLPFGSSQAPRILHSVYWPRPQTPSQTHLEIICICQSTDFYLIYTYITEEGRLSKKYALVLNRQFNKDNACIYSDNMRKPFALFVSDFQIIIKMRCPYILIRIDWK